MNRTENIVILKKLCIAKAAMAKMLIALVPILILPVSKNVHAGEQKGYRTVHAEVEVSAVDRKTVQTSFEEITSKIPKAVINDGDGRIALSKYLDYAEDPSGLLDASMILEGKSGSLQWRPHRDEKIPNLGYTESVYWLRLAVENRSTARDEFFIELSYHFLNYVEFYAFTKDGNSRLIKTGNQYPYYHRPVDHQNFVFPLSMYDGDSVLIMFRIKSISTMTMPLTLWDHEYFHSVKSRETIIYGLYYGMITVMILYNLFLFVSIKSHVYILYSFYAFSSLLLQMSFNGLGFKYLWPENMFLSKFSPYIFASLSCGLIALFTQAFLQTKTRQPLMHYIISAAFYPWIVIVLFFSMTGIRGAAAMTPPLPVIGASILFMAGIFSWFKGYRPARFYFFAFSATLIGAVMTGLMIPGVLPRVFITEYSLQIGSALEIVLLSFALGDKIRIEQDEARKNIEELNNTLERKVEEKTGELVVANSKLKEMDRLKTSFFQGISHEIRTPITLILNPLESESARMPENVNIITALKNSRRLLRLVNQLLDFQKYSIANSSIELVPVNMNELVKAIGDYFREAVNKKNVKFSMKINDMPYDAENLQNIYIRGQTDALEKIIFNYLSNALKFVGENGNITLNLQKIENEAIISVIDDGPGITEENLKKLFNLFAQVDDTHPKTCDGSGIGLALTKELTEKMGGRVDVSSVYGRGSCFSAIFPVLKTISPSIDIVIAISDNTLRCSVENVVSAYERSMKVRVIGDILEIREISRKFSVRAFVIDVDLLGMYANRSIQEFGFYNPSSKIYLLHSDKSENHANEIEKLNIKARQFKYPWDTASVLDEIMKELLEIRDSASPETAGEIKIRDWHLAEMDETREAEQRDAIESECRGSEGAEHILLVEDSIDMLRLISGYFKESGYRVSTALNGKEALSKCRFDRPDIILSDWMMPVMSGPEFIQKIKEDNQLSSIPAILLTAKNDPVSKKEGLHLGADAFLGKPFDKLELLSLVKNLLKLKKGEMRISALNREIADGVLRRFLPPELIKGILEGESVFDNKPKNTKVTILIVNISRFKENLDELGPLNIADILCEYYSEMTSIIFSSKGIVDRFEDGSIRALFGVPTNETAEVQVEQAAVCAINMSKKLTSLLNLWNAKYEMTFNYKMAIHYGEAVVGAIGSPLRTDYTAIGTAVHITRQIEAFAKDGEILISKDGRDYLKPEMWVKHENFILEGTGRKMTVALLIDPSSTMKETA
ncbi:MAG: response regulator [Oligoflexales bacterium]|nr:response regulator [Oligoflexales bacterium]